MAGRDHIGGCQGCCPETQSRSDVEIPIIGKVVLPGGVNPRGYLDPEPDLNRVMRSMPIWAVIRFKLFGR